LQRSRQRLGAVLMVQRLVAQRGRALQVVGEQLALLDQVQPLAGGLRAVLRCVAAVLGSQFTLLGGEYSALRGGPALTGGPRNEVDARRGALTVVALGGSIELGHRDIARLRAVIALGRGSIAIIRARVTLIGEAQAHDGDTVAILGGVLTLAGASLANVMAVIVDASIGTMLKLAIAGGLIAIGGQLVLIGARLVTVRAGLVGI